MGWGRFLLLTCIDERIRSSLCQLPVSAGWGGGSWGVGWVLGQRGSCSLLLLLTSFGKGGADPPWEGGGVSPNGRGLAEPSNGKGGAVSSSGKGLSAPLPTGGVSTPSPTGEESTPFPLGSSAPPFPLEKIYAWQSDWQLLMP